ncbi:DUF742 domain-containing protein [Streptomyces sp. 4N509B]|uniref:DUF742 domain-containing protein n=1 Tax=Streptomyces sp. 4N509B TaxID=3457413 RepID=UPI003FD10C20
MDRRLIPPYVWTGGRTRPSRNVLDRMTVLRAATDHVPVGVSPAGQQVLARVLRAGALPLAELAADLSLPVSFVKVLACDLFDAGWLVVRTPASSCEQAWYEDEGPPDTHLLERVIDGLKALP